MPILMVSLGSGTWMLLATAASGILSALALLWKPKHTTVHASHDPEAEYQKLLKKLGWGSVR